jgi:hypothetical protein
MGERNFIKRLDQLLLPVMSTVRFLQRSQKFNRREVPMGFIADKMALKPVSLTSNAVFLCQSSSVLCIYRRSRDGRQPQSAFRYQSLLIRPDLQPDRPCKRISRPTCISWILFTLCMQVNDAHEFISHWAPELNLHVGISKLCTPYLALLNTAITSNNTQFK